MKKIPTVFKRAPDDMKHVLPEVTPGCEWVLNGEGVATRKYDGTCVMLDVTGRWWARREVKPGKSSPPDFVAVSTDENTGKIMGWEPIASSGFAKWHAEALISHPTTLPGTYELCGPKINSNPESFDEHTLVPHGLFHLTTAPRDFDGLREYLLGTFYEGIVWHHDDGRMAKLKTRDFA